MPQILVYFDRTYAIDVLDLSDAYLTHSSLPSDVYTSSSSSEPVTTDNNNELQRVQTSDKNNNEYRSYDDYTAYLYDIYAPIPPYPQALAYRLCQLLYHEQTNLRRIQLLPSSSPSLLPVPYQFLFTTPDGKLLPSTGPFNPRSFGTLRSILKHTLYGGKGGFGANLKASGKQQLAKQTTDFSACRDLSGRRLRDINNEIRLKKWLSNTEKERRTREGTLYEEAKGDNGIQGWFLNVPSWIDRTVPSSASTQQTFQQKRSRLRKKTIMCRNWLDHHNQRTGTSNSSTLVSIHGSIHDGCPRGNHCEYAHGNEELTKYRSILTEENLHLQVPKEEEQFKKQNETQKQLDSYVKGMYVYDDDDDDYGNGDGSSGNSNRMIQSVQQGIVRGSINTNNPNQGGIGIKRTLTDNHHSLSYEGKPLSKRSKEEDSTVKDNDKDSSDDDDDNIDWGQQFNGNRNHKKNNNTSRNSIVNPVSKWDTILSSNSSASSSSASFSTVPVSLPSITNPVNTSSSSLSMVIPFSPPDIYRSNEWIYTPIVSAVDIEYIPAEEEGGKIENTNSSSISDSTNNTVSEASLVRVTGNIPFSTIVIGSCLVPPFSMVPSVESSSSSSSSSTPKPFFLPHPLVYVYEVEILTCTGIIQIGWADNHYFQPVMYRNEGVGDDNYSYSYDGLRGLKWHASTSMTNNRHNNDDNSSSGGSSSSSSSNVQPTDKEVYEEGSSPYGKVYQQGDIITCYIIIDNAGNGNNCKKDTRVSPNSSCFSSSFGGSLDFIPEYQASIGYRINGEDMGIAFIIPLRDSIFGNSSSSSSVSMHSTGTKTNIVLPFQRLVPAISLDQDESICINIGQQSLMYNFNFSYLNTEGAKETVEGIPLYQIRNTYEKRSTLSRTDTYSTVIGTNDDHTVITTTSSTERTLAITNNGSTDKLISSTSSIIVPVLGPLIDNYLEQLYTEGTATGNMNRTQVYNQSIFNQSLDKFVSSLPTVTLDELKMILYDYGLKTSGTLSERFERIHTVLSNLSTIEPFNKNNSINDNDTDRSVCIHRIMDTVIPKKIRSTGNSGSSSSSSSSTSKTTITYPSVRLQCIIERLLYGNATENNG